MWFETQKFAAYITYLLTLTLISACGGGSSSGKSDNSDETPNDQHVGFTTRYISGLKNSDVYFFELESASEEHPGDSGTVERRVEGPVTIDGKSAYVESLIFNYQYHRNGYSATGINITLTRHFNIATGDEFIPSGGAQFCQIVIGSEIPPFVTGGEVGSENGVFCADGDQITRDYEFIRIDDDTVRLQYRYALNDNYYPNDDIYEISFEFGESGYPKNMEIIHYTMSFSPDTIHLVESGSR